MAEWSKALELGIHCKSSLHGRGFESLCCHYFEQNRFPIIFGSPVNFVSNLSWGFAFKERHGCGLQIVVSIIQNSFEIKNV